MILPKTSILVTGGAGYIGSHTCKALFLAGYNPIVFDNFYRGHKYAVKWGKFIQGDLTDAKAIHDVIHEYRPAAIMHFAALAYVAESLTNPSKYYHNNIVGSYNLLEAARKENVDNIVFSSTCATYGIPAAIPILEQHPQDPINPYGATKLAVERMLKDYEFAYGIRSIILRYFNAAGADPDEEIGEDHMPESHLIPLLLDVAAGRLPYITIFGTDYDTVDGTCVRDYVHVADLAKAHVKALDILMGGGKSDSFNLGYGRGLSVRELVEIVAKITGKTVPVVEGQRRDGDPPVLVSATYKARNKLCWEPVYNDINVIVRHAWQWHNITRGEKSVCCQ